MLFMVPCGFDFGEVPERSKGHAWKACVRLYRTEGSNPSLSEKDKRRKRDENPRKGFEKILKDFTQTKVCPEGVRSKNECIPLSPKKISEEKEMRTRGDEVRKNLQ